jgi:L-ascorbate metabolism protein UlaG (beta-lactamase superfamily)
MNYDPFSKKFINPHLKDSKRTLKDAILWKLGFFDQQQEETKHPKGFVYPFQEKPLNSHLPSATWINHSTFFIKMDGAHFLTDPIWSDRCSPFSFIGPKRRHKPPIELAHLQKVDYVLISHNHYDHLDKKTIQLLHQTYPNIEWFVPKGVKKWFLAQGISRVEEFSWWQSVEKNGFRFTAVPSQHFSGRSLFDLDKTLWAGWVVESLASCGKRFYFVGDTGYNEVHFKEIGAKWPFMDLSLIPIGTYIPKRFMSPVHISPEEAVKIHKEVHSKKSLGMHWKTFRLSDEEELRPTYDLWIALQKENISAEQFLALLPGIEVNW